MAQEPQSIEMTPEGLAVQWEGEHYSLYPYKRLRESCRCAKCVDEWSGKRILDTDAVPEEIEVLDFLEVGRYGIQILWSDAHETGIYAFDLLRSLCQCERCAAARMEPGAGG